jgi:DNA-binding transcriptional LysR family regulator
VHGRLRSNVGEVLRDAALAGQGIALHSLWHVAEDLSAGRLQRVLPQYQIPDSAIYAVMPQRQLIPLRVRAFVDYSRRDSPSLPHGSERCRRANEPDRRPWT